MVYNIKQALFALLFTASPIVILAATEQDSIKPLKIGDQIPDIEFNEVRNYPGGKFTLSNFKGKLIILDFWTRYCAPCIAGFPKLEVLQNNYRDKVQVILVTRNKKSDLNFLFKNSKIINSTSLPMIIGDTILNRYFPHLAVPQQFFIDTSGKVLLSTTESNVQKIINTYFSKARVTQFNRDVYSDFDIGKSLLFEGGGRQRKNLKVYSYIMGRLDGFDGGGITAVRDTFFQNKLKGIQAFNCSIVQLYEYALNFNLSYGENITRHLVLDVKEPQKFQYPDPKYGDAEEWKYRNLYSYGILMDDATDDKLRSFLYQDLVNYFGITATIEKRRMKCLILKRKDTNEVIGLYVTGKLKPSGGNGYVEEYENGYIGKNIQFSKFVWRLNIENGMGKDDTPLILNESGYNGQVVDITINSPLTNIALLKKELSLYNLSLVEGIRDVEVLVLKEKHDIK